MTVFINKFTMFIPTSTVVLVLTAISAAQRQPDLARARQWNIPTKTGAIDNLLTGRFHRNAGAGRKQQIGKSNSGTMSTCDEY